MFLFIIKPQGMPFHVAPDSNGNKNLIDLMNRNCEFPSPVKKKKKPW